MSDKESRNPWKRNNSGAEPSLKGDYVEDINFKPSPGRYDNRRKSNSPSSSRSGDFSRSRSRSKSKGKKREFRKKRSTSKSRSRSHSQGYRSSSEAKRAEFRGAGGQKGPALNFLLFTTRSLENEIAKSQIIKKVKIFKN